MTLFGNELKPVVVMETLQQYTEMANVKLL